MVRLAVAIALAGLAAGCSSGAADKAGGSSAPLVLRLANSNNNDQPDTDALEHFAAQVGKLSGGSLRVRITYLAAGSDTPYVESRTINAVRAGRFDLGWVGARAWDLEGVKSFRALQAPFLITSMRLLHRVVRSRVAARMLDSLSTHGVVGLALVPDFLRHPVGMGRAFVTPADFRGARIRIQPSRVTAKLIRALGAVPLEISNNQIGLMIDQKRVDAQEVAMLNSPGGSVVTEDLVFFGKALTLFANEEAYKRLSDGQRRILREAAAGAVRFAIDHDPPDSDLAKGYCYDRRRIVLAKPAAVNALIHEAQPVYEWLEADPQTRRFIEQIKAWKHTTPPDPSIRSGQIPARCRRAQPQAQAVGSVRPPSLLDGTYRWVITKTDAQTFFHAPPHPGDTFPIVETAILRNGTWRMVGADHDHGTYMIQGNRVRFVWPRVASVLVFTFVRHEDEALRLKPVLPMDDGDQFIWSYKTWLRIGPPTNTAH